MAISTAGYIAGALALWVLTIAIGHITSPLRSIPGPFIARYSKIWFLYRVWRGRFDLDIVALHQRHGSIVRVGPNNYSFSDPEAVKVIYGKGTEFDKSDWYEAWNAPGFKSLFTEPSVKIHGQERRKFQSMYSMSSMVHYEAFVNTCIALLCKQLEQIANSTGETDLYRWLLSYAADSVSMITYSRRMGFLDAGDDVEGFLETMHGNFTYSSLVGIYAGLHPLIHNTMAWLNRFKISGGTPRMYIARFNANLIAEKRNERKLYKHSDSAGSEVDDSAPKDFLSKFLDFHEQDSSRFTERDIHVGLLGNIIAGSDTTGAALTATFYCLLKNPTSFSKLRAEIATHAESGNLSSPPTFKESNNMPYLQACVQEALRLCAPVGLPLQRVVPPGGAQICGHFFPAGYVVGVHAGVMHSNRSIFGDDAAIFRPERWLDTDKEKLSNMQRYWMPFGLGSRTCIGRHISMLEILKSVPELIRRFDFELGNELKGDNAQMDLLNRWFLLPIALPVKIKMRPK